MMSSATPTFTLRYQVHPFKEVIVIGQVFGRCPGNILGRELGAVGNEETDDVTLVVFDLFLTLKLASWLLRERERGREGERERALLNKEEYHVREREGGREGGREGKKETMLKRGK